MRLFYDLYAGAAQSVEQRITGGIYGDGFALKDTKASRKYMPDSNDAVWENTRKKLLLCTIQEDSEKLRHGVGNVPRASRKEEEQEKVRGKNENTINSYTGKRVGLA
ncbi:MAG: hypothetical protein K2N38_12070 [Oscillospiraceae bacterium]|nr:hypothetical protein [Oscillospiraceae bacterium]